MDEAVFTSWPVDGSAPALTFYYNINDLVNNYISENLVISEVNLYLGEKKTEYIGYLQSTETSTTKSYNSVINVMFTSGGSIGFQDNELTTNSTWGPNQQLVFRIVNGSGPYQFVEGYFVIDTDNQGGRFIKVYFGINKSVPAY